MDYIILSGSGKQLVHRENTANKAIEWASNLVQQWQLVGRQSPKIEVHYNGSKPVLVWETIKQQSR